MTDKQRQILEVLYLYSAKQYFMTQVQLIDMVQVMGIIRSRSYIREQIAILDEQKFLKREALPGTRFNLVSLRRKALLMLSSGEVNKADTKSDLSIRMNINRTYLILWALQSLSMDEIKERTSFLTGSSYGDVVSLYTTLKKRYRDHVKLENLNQHIQELEIEKKNHYLILRGEAAEFNMRGKNFYTLINKNRIHFAISNNSGAIQIKCYLIPETGLTAKRIEQICKKGQQIFSEIFKGAISTELIILCGSNEIRVELENKLPYVCNTYTVFAKETDLQKFL